MDELNDPQQPRITLVNLLHLNPKPTPIAGMCNPLCPYFRCEKESLQALTVSRRGIPVNKPLCLVIGGECIGLKCRYSRCKLLLADTNGRCLAATLRSKRA